MVGTIFSHHLLITIPKLDKIMWVLKKDTYTRPLKMGTQKSLDFETFQIWKYRISDPHCNCTCLMFQRAKGKTQKADRETGPPPRSRPQKQGRSFYPRWPGETERNLWLPEVARTEPQGEHRRLQVKVQFWAGQLAVQTFTFYGMQWAFM